MTDHPIIFSGTMVRALLDGRKTMTRRLAWHKKWNARPSSWQCVKPGDRLWVREGWRWNVDYHTTCYRLDYPDGEEPPVPDRFYRWRSPVHMARNQSRLTLIVTARKIERLQNISEADALAEGIDDLWLVQNHVPPPRVHSFKYLWEDLHGAGTWHANPEVVALTFTVHKQNINTLPKAEAA